MKRIALAALGFALAIGASACSEMAPPAELLPNLPEGMVLTNPLASSSNILADGTARQGSASVAYLSAAPGTLGISVIGATVRNQSQGGGIVYVTIVDGGFDPVAIPADAGDRLEFLSQLADGTTTSITLAVPPRRRPSVVRSQPPKGRTDVAVNSQIRIVFTEPIASSSATTSSIVLLLNGNTVAGQIQLSIDALSADFVPDVVLEPLTTYSLQVTQQIRDVDGEPLDEPFVVTFTTGMPLPPPVTLPPPVNGSIAFTTDRHGEREIYVMNPDGTNQVRLTNNTIIDDFPAWSPNRQKIAFLSGTSGQNGSTCEQCAIYTMNADGTGKTFVTALTGAGSWPFYGQKISWSPDGGRIAFEDVVSNRVNVFVVNIDGTNRVNINDNGGSPSWSPDGSKIMFSRETTPGYGLHLYTMNPNGTGVTLVVTGAGDPWYCYAFGGAEWSPTGEKIIYGATCWEDFMSVFVSQADGTNRQMVAGHWTVGNAGSPKWAPEGTWFVFADFWVREIFIGNVDGSPRIQLTTLGNNFNPAW